AAGWAGVARRRRSRWFGAVWRLLLHLRLHVANAADNFSDGGQEPHHETGPLEPGGGLPTEPFGHESVEPAAAVIAHRHGHPEPDAEGADQPEGAHLLLRIGTQHGGGAARGRPSFLLSFNACG